MIVAELVAELMKLDQKLPVCVHGTRSYDGSLMLAEEASLETEFGYYEDELDETRTQLIHHEKTAIVVIG